jgi:putative N6-adenine-specific DNA methylase
MTYRLFVVTAPGLEPYTHQELAGMGIQASSPRRSSVGGKLHEEGGGVELEGALIDIYRTNLHLRSASRITVRMGEFNAAAFSELRKKAARLPWEGFIRAKQPVSVRATCHKSRLYHSDAVAERVVGAISDRLGQPVQVKKYSEETPPLPQLVIVRILFDHVTISLDTSGMLLHRRGYHLETAKAPIRETLASALIFASGWDTLSPLLDPFCGSGTIAIEAALLSRQIAPGKNRRFAFMDWPNYDPDLWQSLIAEAALSEKAAAPRILASDRDQGAMRIAQANADRAGVLDDIQFSIRAISAVPAPHDPGWIITNPPYGVRVSPSRDLRNLYAQFGNVLRANFRTWNFGFLCSSGYLAGHTQLQFEQTISLVNGGLSVNFYQGRVK